jgi:nucleotide-binding universal stress UspA family protein
VLVVRPPENSAWEGLNVLLGYDAPNCSRQAAVVSRITWPPGSTGQVIAAIDALPTFPTWLEQRARSADAEAIAKVFVHEHEEEVRQLRQKLSEFVKELPPLFHGLQPIVAEGYASEKILSTAAECKADLIVVGKASKSFYQRFVLGSTSEAVLSHAHCSVLVVPLGDQP